MNKSILRSALVAAAVSLSLPAPATQAPAATPPRDTGVAIAIAVQGDLALHLIRQEMLVAGRARPALPPRPRLQVVDVHHGRAGTDPAVTLLARN